MAEKTMPKFVFLWTDAFLWGLALAIVLYLVVIARRVALRGAWLSVVRTPSAAAAGVVLLVFFFIGLLDPIHYRPLLPASNQAQQTQHYAPFVRSALDEVLGWVGLDAKERSYSAPFARTLFFKETQIIDDEPVRDFPPLVNAAHGISDDVAHRDQLIRLLGKVLLWGAIFVVLLRFLLFALVRALQRKVGTLQPRSQAMPAAVKAAWLRLSTIVVVLVSLVNLIQDSNGLDKDQSGIMMLKNGVIIIRKVSAIKTLIIVAMLSRSFCFRIFFGYCIGLDKHLIQCLYNTSNYI